MELELDGEPRNRTQAREESPHATRWRVAEQEIVADLDVATNGVRVRVGERHVGDLAAQGGSHRFMLAAGSGYRGGDQVEARIHRDARTDMLTLWVDGIEIQATSRPAPLAPRLQAPSPTHRPPIVVPVAPPLPPSSPGLARAVVLLVAVLAIGGTTAYFAFVRKTPTLEEETAACLQKADLAAEEATKRHVNDQDVAEQRRLSRIGCKQRETECKRDPRGFICLMNPK